MAVLHRHRLVWLDEFGWYRVLALAQAAVAAPDEAPGPVLSCLNHWAEHDWPLVVTRQPAHPAQSPCAAVDAEADSGVATIAVLPSTLSVTSATSEQALALGLPAPAIWGRVPIAVRATLHAVTREGDFPLASALATSPQTALPAPQRADWLQLCDRLARAGITARVYGSHGWQLLTGMDYVHAASDIDLLLAVDTPAQADAACALLHAASVGGARIDGELAFADGAAVAWREWARFRAGEVASVLVKRIASATLEDAGSWAPMASAA